MTRVIVPAGLPYITAAGSRSGDPGDEGPVLSPYTLKWPLDGGHLWVYLDTFSKSVTLAAAPPALASASSEAVDTLIEQRVLRPSGFDVREEVLTYAERLREHVFYLEVANTHRCDLGCAVCYRNAPGVDRRADMSPATAERLAEWVGRRVASAEFSELCVDFLGGEPLLAEAGLRRLLGRFAEIAGRNGLELQANLVTNATRLGPDLARELARVGLTGLQITFEGPPLVHNARRGLERDDPGSFEAQAALLRELRASGSELTITVRVNYDRHNLAHLPALMRGLGELAAEGCFSPENLFISPVVKVFPQPHRHLDEHAYSPLEAAEVMGDVLETRLRAGLGIAGADLVPEYPCRFYLTEGYSVDAEGRFFTCGSLVGTAAHTADLDRPPDEPNWRRDDLSAKCLACSLLPTCFGGCPNDGPVNQAGVAHCPEEFIEAYLRAAALSLGQLAVQGIV